MPISLSSGRSRASVSTTQIPTSKTRRTLVHPRTRSKDQARNAAMRDASRAAALCRDKRSIRPASLARETQVADPTLDPGAEATGALEPGRHVIGVRRFLRRKPARILGVAADAARAQPRRAVRLDRPVEDQRAAATGAAALAMQQAVLHPRHEPEGGCGSVLARGAEHHH